MKNSDLLYYIGDYLGDCASAFEGAQVAEISLTDGNSHLYTKASFPHYVPYLTIKEAQRQVKEAVGLEKVTISGLFPCEEIELLRDDLAMILRDNVAAANGFLNDAVVDISGGKVSVNLTDGASVLNGAGADRFVCNYISEHFGLNYSCTISGDAGVNITDPEYIKKQADGVNVPIITESDGPKKPVKAFDDLPISVTNSKVLYGMKIKSRPVPISSVTTDAGTVTVWGSVFDSDIRETKDGRNNIFKFCISDKTDTYTVKLFASKEESKTLASSLKDEIVLMVRGRVEYDSYIKTFCINAGHIMTVELMEETDEAPEKRVELHLHTNMSQMDGLTSAGKLVKRAAKWGHKAIAITDHGVVQAFPDAYAASKETGIKVIYGMEGYYVDDSVTAVVGGDKMPIDGTFTVFDIETTGLRTGYDRIIEIGAVRITDGVESASFRTFVDPERKIPASIVELTGIDDSMVAGAPKEEQAVRDFLKFAEGSVLVAHNATFDTDTIKATCARHGIGYNLTHIDTLLLSQELCDYDKIKTFKLDHVANYFKLPKFDHHRADEDARILSMIFAKLVELMKGRGITAVEQINDVIKPDPCKLRSYHIILLAKNTLGLKNLYKLISYSNLSCFRKNPRIPLSVLQQYREGILVGSACEAGQLYQAVLSGKDRETQLKYAAINDYLEIQPNGNNAFMLRDGTLASEEELNDINRQIIALADELKIPVVATGDVHFIDESDKIYREILMTTMGFSDADRQAPLYFRTTDNMLNEFSWLGEEKAKEIVVTNPGRIADMCERIQPVPNGVFTPDVPGSDTDLRRICNERMEAYYGAPLPQYIRERLDKELDSIISHGFAPLYMIAQKLVANSMENGYYVGSRGSVGSSFVAFASGISEVNPLAPHYLCPKCKKSEFYLKGEYGSGFDMPPRECPDCHVPMLRDGHDIPFETFLGFYGDKQPDIDLNFASEYQFRAHRYTETLFAPGHVFKAGTIGTIADKTAFGFVKKWIEENLKKFCDKAGNPRTDLTAEELEKKRYFENMSEPEKKRLSMGCVGVKRTTGQHPGGMVVVPNVYEAQDFTPIQHPADDPDSIHKTTHFDFHFLHDTILKLDNLGHEVPTMYHHLEKLTGTSVMDADVCDPKLYELLTSPEPLGVTAEDIDCPTGTLSLPELGTPFVLGMLTEAKPKNFSDMLQISGLSHGTDVWLGNAQELIKDGTCTISDVIGTRDSIMVYLIHKGVEKGMAFKIMEIVRKGKAPKLLTDEHKQAMLDNGVPQWYLDSCLKIKYMFPKAHAAAYVIAAMRLAWYKLYYPVEYYATYLTVRGGDLETATVLSGRAAVKSRMSALNMLIKTREASAKEEDIYTSLQVMNEMMARGVELLPIDIYKSTARRYIVEDGKIRLPFTAMTGCGLAAAESLEKAKYKTVTDPETGEVTVTDEIEKFLSIEDVQLRSKAGQAMIDALESVGAFADLPKSTQLSFF